MSSNEPVQALSEETIQALNQAIKNRYPKQLEATITSVAQPLDVSYLEEAWRLYQHDIVPYTQKNQCLSILFEHCHFPEQQRIIWAQRLIEHSLQTYDLLLAKSILSRLDPTEDMPPLATWLIQNRFSELCRYTSALFLLFQHIPKDRLNDLCRQLLEQVQPSDRQALQSLLQRFDLPDPLAKALICYLSEPCTDTAATAAIAALSDDWQTVFRRIPLEMLKPYGSYVITGQNLASFLIIQEESQRMERLQTLFFRSISCYCFQQLGKNEEALRIVLELLPLPQRIQLLLFATEYGIRMYSFIQDELWPAIHPLLNPSDTATILESVLAHDDDKPIITNLVTTIPDTELWRIWQGLSRDALSRLFKSGERLAPLLSQLPTEAQQLARKQFFAHLRQSQQQIELEPWLQNERYFSTLCPAAHHWLNESDRPLQERLSLLATQSTTLHAFLDNLPESEREILIPWLVSTTIEDVDVLNGLLDRYTDADHPCLNYVLPGNWENRAQKMPQILAIAERLSEKERLQFSDRHLQYQYFQVWKPENYQIVRRAWTLFDVSPDSFLQRVGLHMTIPRTPLMQAARYDDPDTAKKHLSSLNEQDWLGRTALMHALLDNNQDMATFLSVQPGCDFSLTTLHDETVFAYAAQTKNTKILQHLLRISPCKPTPQDAMVALCFALGNTKLIDFLFEAFFPGIAWQQTTPSFKGSRFQHDTQKFYEHSELFQMYYAKATLPFALRHNQLSKLTLTPNPPGIFRYQMQALGVDASQDLRLDSLLQALTGRAPAVLELSGFHIHEHELDGLSDFIKNNPRLKVLSVGTLHLHLEKAQLFAKTLREVAGQTTIVLTIHEQPKIQILPVKAPVRGVFFELEVVQETEAQASCSLRL